MVTKQYTRILEEDRRGLSEKMEQEDFFTGASKKESQESSASQMQQLLALAEKNPELLNKMFDSLKLLT